MIPVRCFTCNNMLGHLYAGVEAGAQIDHNYFQKHKIDRYCCRKVLTTHVDIYRNSFQAHDQSFFTLKKNNEVELILSTK